MLGKFIRGVKHRLRSFSHARKWARRTLVVGPVAPVDGDSVACCRAVVDHLRARGKEAYTLPTVAMYPQIQWVLSRSHLHPSCYAISSDKLTTPDLQAAYDALLKEWQPDEIVMVDGRKDRLGFDPHGVPIFEIDHHVDHGTRDDEEAYVQPASSAGCLLIKKYRIYDPILVVSILTDTYWLRQNMPSQAIESLTLLRKHGGLTDQLLIDIQRQLKVPGDPNVIEAMRRCKMRTSCDGIAFAVLDTASPEVHRGVCGELGYFFNHLCVVRADGYASLRTNNDAVNLGVMAGERWRGGGHPNMAVANLTEVNDVLLNALWEDFVQTVRGVQVRHPAACC
ncbi:MAG: hypothetical protein K2W95_31515 [Candidatus Obscuribacterales bacterium]|nr:hypothetical protein [Candidatus Obscuribacterales bacterium]